MQIKHVVLATHEERVLDIFKQLGAREKQVDGNTVLSIKTTPGVMEEKVEIAYEPLKRLGYDQKVQSQKHFWYLSDKHKRLDTIRIESQGSEGFVVEKHEYLIYLD